MRVLSNGQTLFIGFKLETSLRRRLESLEGPDRRYVSADDTTFLTLCRMGEETYVGKLVDEPLSTDRVDDIRRNVLSILQRLCPEVHLPTVLDIVPVDRMAPVAPEPERPDRVQ